jgi:hypothetical protein
MACPGVMFSPLMSAACAAWLSARGGFRPNRSAFTDQLAAMTDGRASFTDARVAITGARQSFNYALSARADAQASPEEAR